MKAKVWVIAAYFADYEWSREYPICASLTKAQTDAEFKRLEPLIQSAFRKISDDLFEINQEFDGMDDDADWDKYHADKMKVHVRHLKGTGLRPVQVESDGVEHFSGLMMYSVDLL